MAGKAIGNSATRSALKRLKERFNFQSELSPISLESIELILSLFLSDLQIRLIVDPRDGKILETNAAASTFYQFSNAELRKKTLADLSIEPSTILQQELESLSKSPSGSFHAVHVTKSGSRREVCLFCQSINVGSVALLNLTVQDLSSQRQAERVQSQLIDLSEAINSTSEMYDLISLMRDRLAALFDTRNFYVALYNPEKKEYSFPFFENENEHRPSDGEQHQTVTDYVRRTGKPLLVDAPMFDYLQKRGEIVLRGKPSAVWMGVPLTTTQEVIGVVGLQHYSDPYAYTESDLEVLEFVTRAVTSTLERRSALQDMQQIEERFRTFFDKSAEGIWCIQIETPIDTGLPVKDQVKAIVSDGRFIECNNTFIEMYQFSSNESVIGKRLTELPIENDDAKSTASLSRFIQEGYRMTEGESWEYLQDGSLRVFMNQLIGIVQEGHLHQIWGAQRDITTRKKIESDLTVQKTHLERFIQNSPEGIVFVDADDRIISVNKEYSRMFEFSENELIGQKNTLIVPKDFQDESKDLAESVAMSESVGLESIRRTKSGHEFEVNILGTPIRIDGELIGTYWVYRDITQQRRSAKLQTALFHISEAATTSSHLEELLSIIHRELGTLIDTENFYVALYNSNRGTYRFAYFVDEQESLDQNHEIELPDSLTDSIRKHGAALYRSGQEIKAASKKNKIKVVGPLPESWLGVPLRAPEGTIGVVVAQSYSRQEAYTKQDMELLEFVSGHIAVAIEHRRWQDAMTVSEERYRTLFRQSPLGVILFDKKFNIVDSNDQMLNMFKLKTGQMVGLNLRELEDDRIVKLARKAIKGKIERVDSLDISFVSNEKRWVTGSISPLYGSDEAVIGGMILFEDITQQRETIRELELQRAYAHHLFEEAPEAIIMINADRSILRVNSEFQRLFGFSEELAGRSIDSLGLQPEYVMEEIDLPEQIRNRSYFSHESIRLNSSGDTIEVSILGGPILIDGALVAYYLIYRDISRRKRSELLQNVLYEIARTAATGIESSALFRLVQEQLGRLIEVNNFSIAHHDEKSKMYSFLYHVDEYETFQPNQLYDLSRTLTDYVYNLGKSQLINGPELKRLSREGIIQRGKKTVKCWIGVPLRLGERVFGVLSVVSYKDSNAFNEQDLQLLEFVSGQIAGMIEYKRADMDLQVSEARYRTLFTQASVGVFLFDRELNVIDVNESLAEMTGTTRDEFLSLEYEQLPDQRLTPMLLAAIDGRSESYSGQFFAKNKRELFITARTSPLINSRGEVEGGISIVVDETSQRKTEQRAEINRIYLEQLFERSPEAIILLDPRMRAIRVNEEFTRLFGYSQSDALGKSVVDLIVEKEHDGQTINHEKSLKKITKGELIHLEETLCRRKDGSLVSTSLLGSPIVVDGKVIALYGIYRDITAQKRAVEDLAEEKERLSVTLSSIGEGVITTDIDGKVAMLNRAAESITGWKNKDAIGKDFTSVFKSFDPETRKPIEDPVQQVMRTGVIEGWARETVLQNHRGHEVIVVGSAAQIHDLAREVIGVVIVFRDVTEQRKLEEEMSKIERLESVGVLAGGIAHDFNNILSAVLGNISLARMIHDDMNMVQERIAESEKAALRARDLTQQLLTFSRGGEPVRKSVDLEDLARESVGFALRGSNVLSEFEVEDGLWVADVDEGQVGRVIHNLIINADQAMPNGGKLRIRLKNEHVGPDSTLTLKPGRYVRLEFMDEGVGIPPEYLQKIFDPFFTTKQRGSGLGLATSFSIVQKHDGAFSVTSKTGKGTTFVVHLPASEVREIVDISKQGGLFHGEGRILVMDDEEPVRVVATAMLEELGFAVETANDGASAIEKYLKAKMEEAPFTAVIMDLTIPGGMGGEETIRHLRKLDSKVKAIVSSGYSNDPIMSNFKEFGFVGVVAKPYRLQDLGATLAEVLAVKEKRIGE